MNSTLSIQWELPIEEEIYAVCGKHD